MEKYPQSGVYEHYKSTPEAPRLYQLLGPARHTESDEELAIYIPLYVTPDHKGLRWQARPLDQFTDKVEVDGEIVPRFRYLGPEL